MKKKKLLCENNLCDHNDTNNILALRYDKKTITLKKIHQIKLTHQN